MHFYARWGYSHMEKTGWERETDKDEQPFSDGKPRKLYVGYFKTIPDRNGKWESVRVCFWAARPILAMRAITEAANKGTHPTKFAEEVVN